MSDISKFTDLVVWQEAHKLVLKTYKLTSEFLKSEVFGLTSQMNRAAISITSNIAEGFSRGTTKEKIRFYRMSHGSLLELENQYIAAHDIGYVDDKRFESVTEAIILVAKLINGTIKSLKNR